MSTIASNYKEELFREIQGLPDEKIKEILDFTYFIKAKDAIDPSQAYFWTKKWQEMERRFHEYQAKWPEIQYRVPEGLFCKYLGDLLLGDGQLDRALESYKLGLPLLARYANYQPFTVSAQLSFTAQTFQNIRFVKSLQHLSRELQKFWIDQGLDVKNPEVLSILVGWQRIRK